MSRCRKGVDTPFRSKPVPCGVLDCKLTDLGHSDWIIHMALIQSWDAAPKGTALWHEVRWAYNGKVPESA